MGNQESVPSSQVNIVKRKKVIKKKEPIKNQQKNMRTSKNNYNNQYKEPNNNLNEYGRQLLNRENIPIPKKNNYNDFSNFNY